MKLYDSVELTEKIDEYNIGTVGTIIELYDNMVCYVELFNEAGDTIGVLYDVPLSKLKLSPLN